MHMKETLHLNAYMHMTTYKFIHALLLCMFDRCGLFERKEQLMDGCNASIMTFGVFLMTLPNLSIYLYLFLFHLLESEFGGADVLLK